MANENDFDVFVARDVMVFVERGARLSIARQFGVEWDGPTHSALHQAVFDPLPAPIRVAQLQGGVAGSVAALSVRERASLAIALATRGEVCIRFWLVVCGACAALWWWKG